MLLFHVFQERKCENKPPEGGQRKADFYSESRQPAAKIHTGKSGDNAEADDERNGAAADISVAVTHGRNHVHLFRRCNIRQGGVVENIGSGKTDEGENVKNQGESPCAVADKQQACRCRHAEEPEDGEQCFSKAFVVRKGSQYRGEERDDNGINHVARSEPERGLRVG